jgi:glycosyltransferase involved in cell wall biosynthesis
MSSTESGGDSLRVAFLSPSWPPDRFPNGIASYVSAIRSGLAPLGVESLVLTSALREEDAVAGVSRLLDSDEGRPFGLRLWQRVAGTLSINLGIQQNLGYRVGQSVKALEASGPLDLVEVEETFGIGAVVHREINTPLIVRLHGPWCVVGGALGYARDKEFWVRCAAEFHAIRRAAAVSSPSQDALDRVRKMYRLDLPDARVIPNPVPIPDAGLCFTTDKRDPDTILFVGRFDRVKGADTLLQAFVRVARGRPSLRLIFMGPDNGLLENGRAVRFEEYIRERVPSALHERIDFRGASTAAEIGIERARAAVTIVSSRYETFCFAALEAMAAGSPLIAARVGGLREIIRDEETGLFFEAENDSDLASKIERLLDDPGLAAKLGASARLHVAKYFSKGVVAAQTLEFYRSVLAQG